MRKNNFGFTILELLITISIISVLSTIVVFTFTGAQKSARDAIRRSDLKQYQTALEVYINKSGSYPVNTAAVSPNTLCTAALLNIPGCSRDPKQASGYVDYRYQSDASGSSYVLWATLERTTQVFYICSRGTSGTASSAGFTVTGGTCP